MKKNSMRKILLLTLLPLLFLTTTMAQEKAICGDWIGVFKSWNIVSTNGNRQKVDADYKRYVRIKFIDSNYTVRMKTRIADNTEPFNYWSESQIIEADDRQIKWKMNLGSDYNWSSDAKHKGIPIGHAEYSMFCTVILLNGTLKYSEYMITTYYDRQGQEIDRERTPPNEDSLLYKNEDDW